MSTPHSPLSPTTPTLDLPSLDDIRAMDTHALVHRMRIGVEHFDPRVFELSEPDLDRAWLPEAGVGRWPVRVLLGHLADTELLFAARIRQTLAETRPTLALFDEHAYIDSGLYGCTEGVPFRPPVGGDVAVIHTTRCWLVALLVQLEPEHWARTALHPERGEISVRDLANYDCLHLEHHAAYLNAKLHAMLGPMPEIDHECCGGHAQDGCCGGGGHAGGSGGCGCGCGH